MKNIVVVLGLFSSLVAYSQEEYSFETETPKEPTPVAQEFSYYMQTNISTVFNAGGSIQWDLGWIINDQSHLSVGFNLSNSASNNEELETDSADDISTPRDIDKNILESTSYGLEVGYFRELARYNKTRIHYGVSVGYAIANNKTQFSATNYSNDIDAYVYSDSVIDQDTNSLSFGTPPHSGVSILGII